MQHTAEALYTPHQPLDPAHAQRFGDFVISHYGDQEDPETAREYIVMDAVEAMLEPDALEQVFAASQFDSHAISQLMRGAEVRAEVQAEYYLSQAKARSPANTLAAAGIAVMARGHRGQFRDTGREYWHHPLEVGALVYDGLSVTLPNQQDREQLIASHLFRAFVHDVPEDQIPKPPGAPDHTPPFSLLQAHKLHEMTENPFGREAVSGLRLMEYHSSKQEPWAPKDRDQYEADVVADPDVGITKHPDLTHNRGEPKPTPTVMKLQRWERKDAAYALLQQRIRQRAAQYAAQAWRVAYHDRIATHTTLESIQAEIGAMSLFIFDREVAVAAA